MLNPKRLMRGNKQSYLGKINQKARLYKEILMGNEIELLDEKLEKEWDEFEKEWELLQKDLDRASVGLDKLFIQLDILMELSSKIEEFNKNITQLDKLISQSYDDNYFVNGCLLCNVCSAFEGFVHDFINLAIKSEENIDNRDLISNANSYLNRSKKLLSSFEEVLNVYKDATLNHPEKILDLCNKLFNFNINYNKPPIENYGSSIVSIRNAFTHNNGYDKNGKFQEITLNIVKGIRNFLVEILDVLNKEFQNKINTNSNRIEKDYSF